MIQRQITIGQRLRLNALRRVHYQKRAFTGSQASGHLVIKVNMSRRINQIERILLSVLCFIDQTDCLRLDRNAAFTFQIHIVKHLILHLSCRQQSRLFNNTVCQRRFAMINVCDNAKISNIFLFHPSVLNSFISSYPTCSG